MYFQRVILNWSEVLYGVEGGNIKRKEIEFLLRTYDIYEALAVLDHRIHTNIKCV